MFDNRATSPGSAGCLGFSQRRDAVHCGAMPKGACQR